LLWIFKDFYTAVIGFVEILKNMLSNIKHYLKPQCTPRWKFSEEYCLLMTFFLVFTVSHVSLPYIPLLRQSLERSYE